MWRMWANCIFKKFNEGVEDVKADSSTGKLTVKGNVDPLWLREKVEIKTKKKVALLSTRPKKVVAGAGTGTGTGTGNGGEEKKSGEKVENNKVEEKKGEDKKPIKVIYSSLMYTS